MQREQVNERSPARLKVVWEVVDGAATLPLSVTYRIDDVISGTNITPVTPATPALETLITITAAENAMVDATRPSEVRRVTWAINEGELGETHGEMLYDLINLYRVT